MTAFSCKFPLKSNRLNSNSNSSLTINWLAPFHWWCEYLHKNLTFETPSILNPRVFFVFPDLSYWWPACIFIANFIFGINKLSVRKRPIEISFILFWIELFRWALLYHCGSIWSENWGEKRFGEVVLWRNTLQDKAE